MILIVALCTGCFTAANEEDDEERRQVVTSQTVLFLILCVSVPTQLYACYLDNSAQYVPAALLLFPVCAVFGFLSICFLVEARQYTYKYRYGGVARASLLSESITGSVGHEEISVP